MRGSRVCRRQPGMTERLLAQCAGRVVALVGPAFLEDRHHQIDEIPQALGRDDAAQIEAVDAGRAGEVRQRPVDAGMPMIVPVFFLGLAAGATDDCGAAEKDQDVARIAPVRLGAGPDSDRRNSCRRR
jgi:hypothetical protein